ncbi:M14-type cytosolic carboxypeptidase [Rhizobium sp. Rhizsp82]|uniref:M14 family metallopeptidase n=1 Tax=Rhizobium sp. Rhizsp82 TaxID=3243057 RepID=UPI0039B4C3D7
MSKISSNFDSGRIKVIDESDWAAMRLAILPDREGSDEFMGFYFAATGAKGRDCHYTLEDAGKSRWSRGFKDYRIVASYDRKDWFRIPATFDGSSLKWSHRPEQDRVSYAYHAPYTETERFSLIERCAASPLAKVESLGKTLEGRSIDLVTVGKPGPGKKSCWVLARQHPGESMTEFAAEALLDRLIDTADPLSQSLLERAVFYVVPNMNPDGSIKGFHRYNAGYVDLNRSWSTTTVEESPETWFVRERMRQTGVHFCYDIHGDESNHHPWPVRPVGVPSWSNKQATLLKRFEDALLVASPNYTPDLPKPNYDHAPGTDPLAMAISWTAETFGCVSFIIELPFLDDIFHPDERNGWSPRRSRLFGAASLEALAAVVDDL